MTVVCATHFSDSSFAAVRVAAAIAKARRQPLWLVSVLPTRHIDPALQQAVHDALVLEASALASEQLDVQLQVLHGPLADAVGRFCSDHRAHLLVVGDSRHHHFATAVDQLASQVGQPLLVVRDPKPFEAWARGEAPLHVLLAVDHTWSDRGARNWLGRFAEVGPIDLTATYLFDPADEYERRHLSQPPGDRTHRLLTGILRDEAAHRLRDLPRNVKRHVRIEPAGPHLPDHLMSVATSERADILVLGTHPHHGAISILRSTAHEVLARAPMSVAAIPGERSALDVAPQPTVH